MTVKGMKRIFVILVANLVVCIHIYSSTESGGIKLDNQSLAQFADYIEQSISNGDPSFFNNSFDAESFIEKILVKSSYSPTVRNFNEGFSEGMTKNLDFGTLIVNEIANGGSYEFLKVFYRDNKPRLLFRLFTANGINYHELEVDVIDNEIKITDAYIYLTGESLSESMRRMYLSFLYVSNTDNQYLPCNQEKYKSVIQLEEIREFMAEGKFKKAKKKWDKIPAHIQQEKAFQLINIQITSMIDNNAYLEAIGTYEKLFPDDASLYLISIDGFVLRNEYTKAIESINKLDNLIGNDPLLNLLRGNMYFEIGDTETANAVLTELVNSMPDFELGYYSLLGLYMSGKKYADATHLMDKMVLDLNYYKEDFNTILSEYPNFLNSDEYLTWYNQ